MAKTVWYLKLQDQPKELKIDETSAKSILDSVRRGNQNIPITVNGKMYGLYRPADIDIYNREKVEEERSSPEFLEHRQKAEKWTDETIAELEEDEILEIKRRVMKEMGESAAILGKSGKVGFLKRMFRIAVRKQFNCPFTTFNHPSHDHREQGGTDRVWEMRDAYRFWKPTYRAGTCRWECFDKAAYAASVKEVA